jgi:hypothetical protein
MKQYNLEENQQADFIKKKNKIKSRLVKGRKEFAD